MALGARQGDVLSYVLRSAFSMLLVGLAGGLAGAFALTHVLKSLDIPFCRFFPAQPATQEDPEQRSISLALERIGVRHLPECSCLVGGEPITKTNAEVFRPFASPNASSKIGAEQAESAASYARSLMAASLLLIVPGASCRDSKWIR